MTDAAAHPGTGPGRWTAALGSAVPAGTALRFRSLGLAPFGVEVAGVDWTAPGEAGPDGGDMRGDVGGDVPDDVPDDVRLLTLALRRHLLLVLRGQPSPTEEQLDRFLRRFGRLVLDTEDGRAHYADHLHRDGPASDMAVQSRQYLQRAADNSGSTEYHPGKDGISELVWHNDQSHRPMLKVLSVFEALDVEDGVVPTEFRDTYTAYEVLTPRQRLALDGRQLVYFNPRLPGPDRLPRLADATHPVFLPHPHTGRRALYANDFADRVVGMDRADSDRQMAALRRHLDHNAPRYRHQWRTGDLVLWDNVGLQHRRDAVPGGQRRVMRQHGGLAE